MLLIAPLSHFLPHTCFCWTVAMQSFLNVALATGLGSTDPCSSAVDMEPLSERHSSRLLTRVLATTTKICTTGGSSRTHVRPSTLTGTPPYSSRHRDLWFWNPKKPIMPSTVVHRERALEPSIFRVACFGRISCYTLLSGCRLP